MSTRENILKILYIGGSMYGYEVYKIYKEVYGEVLLRTIYYHLKACEKRGELKAKKIVGVLGGFTWGYETDRIYYELKEGVEEKLKMNIEEIKAIKNAVNKHKKDLREELRKWVKKLKEEIKSGEDPLRLRRKCEKLKAFYLLKFGKYPKVIDNWLSSLPP